MNNNQTNGIPVLRTPEEMQEWSGERRRESKTIGCVPTMGALHEGHLSLIRASVSECDETIVTIFINPLQFGKNEDLNQYPRNEARDLELAVKAGATIAYCPSEKVMYRDNRSTFVVEDLLSKGMCGASRPGHFRGVATVVAKLFNTCLPHRAYFGTKDYQQWKVVKRMVRDLDFPVDVRGCPIVREEDGLAMSSRNRYLSKEERKDALSLFHALNLIEELVREGETSVSEIKWQARLFIERYKSTKLDYIEIRNADDLTDVRNFEVPVVAALAVYVGKTRLIDNRVIAPETEAIQ